MADPVVSTPPYTVKIDQSGGATTALAAAAPGMVHRLHALLGGLGTDGTYAIYSGSTALTGDIPVAAKVSGEHIPYRYDPNGCHKTARGEALNFVTSQAWDGSAIVSTRSE
jgi:hypothetical protein